MYEELSKRKAKHCILIKNDMLASPEKCKGSNCNTCGWNTYVNRDRKIKQLLNSNAKHWTIRKGLL